MDREEIEEKIEELEELSYKGMDKYPYILNQLDKILEVDATNTNALNFKADLLSQMNREEESQAIRHMVLNINPKDKEATIATNKIAAMKEETKYALIANVPSITLAFICGLFFTMNKSGSTFITVMQYSWQNVLKNSLVFLLPSYLIFLIFLAIYSKYEEKQEKKKKKAKKNCKKVK